MQDFRSTAGFQVPAAPTAPSATSPSAGARHRPFLSIILGAVPRPSAFFLNQSRWTLTRKNSKREANERQQRAAKKREREARKAEKKQAKAAGAPVAQDEGAHVI